MRVRVFTALAAIVAACLLGASTPGQPHPAARALPTVVIVTPGCPSSAPTTPAGFTALWDTLPLAQWGAGDIGLSVPVGNREVWLYGDTFEAHTNGFVHSTAITQDGGCLHVSHAGAQVLPNDDPTHIYWIHDARAYGGGLLINARAITLTGSGPWDFKDGGFYHLAYATITAAGDVTFQRWVSRTVSPAPDPGPMIDCEAPALSIPHHYCYDRFTHPEFRLADGHELVTTSQNWDDGIWHGWDAYRPIFSEQ